MHIDQLVYYHCWCDGSCYHTDQENNWMGMGVYQAQVDSFEKLPIIRKLAISGPKGTHNIAEYLAVMIALTDIYILEGARQSVAEKYIEGPRHVTVHSDSQLIIRQLTGKYAVRDEIMQIFHNEAKAVENLLKLQDVKVEYQWNPRETKNQKVADWLSKVGNKHFKNHRPDESVTHGIIDLGEVLLPESLRAVDAGLDQWAEGSV